METKACYFVVGAFVMSLFVAILLFFLWLVAADFESDKSKYVIYFKGSVTGLSAGSPVRYNGVNVGVTKKIDIDPEDISRVRVLVSLNDELLIREDAVASLEMQGLTGYMFVQLYGGENTSPILKVAPGQEYPVIQSRVSSVEELMSSLPRLMGRLNNLVERASEVFNKENRQAFANSLHNFDKLTYSLRESAKPLKEFLEEAKTQTRVIGDDTQVVLSNLKDVSDNLRTFLDDNKGSLNAFAQSGMGEITRTLSSINEASEQLSGVLQTLNNEKIGALLSTDEGGVVLRESL